eukprot:6298229-Amphidinium_carterae.1
MVVEGPLTTLLFALARGPQRSPSSGPAHWPSAVGLQSRTAGSSDRSPRFEGWGASGVRLQKRLPGGAAALGWVTQT